MPAPAYRIERHGAGEEIVIPARRSLAGFLMLLAWTVSWSLVGALVARWWSSAWLWVVLLWLTIKIVVGWLLAGVALAWMFGGEERLATHEGGLRIRYTIFGVPVAMRTYDGRDMRFFAPSAMPRAGGFGDPVPPFLSSTRCGGLKFFYRQRTIYVGHDLGEEDSRRVAGTLQRGLVPGAYDGHSDGPTSPYSAGVPFVSAPRDEGS